VDLQKVAVVYDASNKLSHIVGLYQVIGDEGLEHLVGTPWVVIAWRDGRVLHVVLRQEAEEASYLFKAFCFRGVAEM
jgi:hypothetical protein